MGLYAHFVSQAVLTGHVALVQHLAFSLGGLLVCSSEHWRLICVL